MTALVAILRRLLEQQEPMVLVRVVTAKGSTPREAGVSMLVTAARVHGTIGGGRLEWDAITRARELLAGDETTAMLEVPLGPASGQCCGGRVTLKLARAGAAELAELESAVAAERAGWPLVLLFGAGQSARRSPGRSGRYRFACAGLTAGRRLFRTRRSMARRSC